MLVHRVKCHSPLLCRGWGLVSAVCVRSSLINALLGEKVLVEGVTPTTSAVHIIRHGTTSRREQTPEGYSGVGE